MEFNHEEDKSNDDNDERIRDVNYYIQREHYATKWATNLLKIMNSHNNYDTL